MNEHGPGAGLAAGGHDQSVETHRSEVRGAFFDGVRRAAPSLVASGTWGLVTGVSMVKSGLSAFEALGMSLLVFAGSAQLASLPLIAAGAPIWVVLLTAVVLNLRFVIFSAGLYPHLRRLPLPRRVLLGYVTADMGFAIALSRWSSLPQHEQGTSREVAFLAGVTASTWITWQATSITGVLLATQIPGTWGLDFAAIVALIALTLPMVMSKPAAAGAAAAGVTAVFAAALPLKLGLLLAVLAGICVAMTIDVLVDRLEPSR
jgi:predicted branched-subunit amino acid permease